MSEYTSELHPEFLSMSAINSLVGHNSSPRVVMDSSHFSAKMTLNTPDEKLIKSGIEYELGKYLNDARIPEDSIIKAIIPKYREDGKESPSYTVLFEYERNGQIFIDYINVDNFTSQHNFFGNLLYKTEDFYNLGYNTAVPKGTILATTSSYGENGAYNFGLNASVAFMSHPAVAEDGFAVSESFLNRATFQSVLKRSINITKDTIPVNLYGDQDIFKFLPNIGEKVRPDGLLCALRQRNDWFSIGDMSTNNLSEVDVSFDNLIYVNPNSTVIDITVTKGNYAKNEFSDKITQQLDHYAHMLTLYHSTVVDKFDFIMKEKQRTHGSTEGIRLTPRLHTFITDVNIKLAAARNAKQKLCYRKIPIDQYRIDIVTTSTLRPNLGFKMSDVHGAKGVICRILPDYMMPVDSNGVRAEIIADDTSTISRMNIGRAYEGYLGATSRDNRLFLIKHFSQKYGDNFLEFITDEDLDYFYNYVKGLYSLINSQMLEFIVSLSRDELYQHLVEVITKQLFLYIPTNNDRNICDEVIPSIENSIYKPHSGKVKYVNDYGEEVTTVDNIRISQMYYMMLEKVALDYSAVSSSKVNNFGFPVKGTNLDKVKYPHSLTPTKVLGETETRILTSFAPPEMVADLYDLALNPVSHKLLVKSIITSDSAFNQSFDIDRKEVEYGQTKSLMILRHLFNSFGFDFTYEPEQH